MTGRLIPLIVCLAAMPAFCPDAQGANSGDQSPGTWRKIAQPWKFFRKSEGNDHKASAKWKDLTLTLKIEPVPLKLGESRQLKATLILNNEGKNLKQLTFPTTQRIEVLVRNQAGKIVEQWSEDQSFSDEMTMVSVNPSERLEYTVSVSTRDMVAGQRYSVEAYISGYSELKAVKDVIPEA